MTKTCARCGAGPLIPYVRWCAGDRNGVRHCARGLCSRCWFRSNDDGTLIDYPRATMSRAELLEDFRLLREQGLDRRQIAERLGMRKGSLNQALRRAELAGAL